MGDSVPGVQRAARRPVLQVDQHRPRQPGQFRELVVGEPLLGVAVCRPVRTFAVGIQDVEEPVLQSGSLTANLNGCPADLSRVPMSPSDLPTGPRLRPSLRLTTHRPQSRRHQPSRQAIDLTVDLALLPTDRDGNLLVRIIAEPPAVAARFISLPCHSVLPPTRRTPHRGGRPSRRTRPTHLSTSAGGTSSAHQHVHRELRGSQAAQINTRVMLLLRVRDIRLPAQATL
ncbi:MAG: hypothetical protein QOE53_1442 [Pseudonocardiales bacterium]|nr:hypothetical protein [Pseudonocardiales bacterium]